MNQDDILRRCQNAAAQQAGKANEYLQQQGLGQLRPYGLSAQEQSRFQGAAQDVSADHVATANSKIAFHRGFGHDHVSGEAYMAMKARAERAERRVAELADQLQPKDDEIRRLKAENHDLMRKGQRHGER